MTNPLAEEATGFAPVYLLWSGDPPAEMEQATGDLGGGGYAPAETCGSCFTFVVRGRMAEHVASVHPEPPP